MAWGRGRNSQLPNAPFLARRFAFALYSSQTSSQTLGFAGSSKPAGLYCPAFMLPCPLMFLYGVLWSLAILLCSWISRRIRCDFRHTGSRRLPTINLRRNRKKPLWVVNALIRIKALCPNYGCTKVAHVFNRLYAHRGVSVSRSYVAYTIRDHLHEILQYRRAMRKRRAGRFLPNRSWAIDLTGKQDACGKAHAILGIMDQGTRRALCLSAVSSKCSWTLLGYLFLAIRRYGKPEALKSDNEAVFKSRLFRAALRICAIRQQFSAIGCPWMNGKIERFFGILKQALNFWQVPDVSGLQRSLIHPAIKY